MYAKRQSLKSATALGSTLLVSLISASGCAPLQQAPLAYTSAQVVGVKLGVAPTQPESLEAVVGVKILDAAYAPVAVSNPGLKDAVSSGKPFDESLYAIKEIYGIYGQQASADAAAKLLTTQESKDMQRFLKYQADLDSKKTKAQELKAKLDAISTATSRVESLRTELRSPPCKGTTDADKVSDLLKSLSACKTEGGVDPSTQYAADLKEVLDKDTTSIKASEKEISEKYAAANRELAIAETVARDQEAKVKGALEKLASIQKRDAISVYGSFNSDSTAGSKGDPTDANKQKDSGVDVRIGKVFSTGVAAQNISEAQKLVAGAAALDVCLRNIPRMFEGLTEAERKPLRAELVGLCADKIMPSATQQK
ncbi:hypothetical protein QYE80_22605 [Pseudomonas tohonis]|nr:hypothetical protein [Pseudomonas tohonis]